MISAAQCAEGALLLIRSDADKQVGTGHVMRVRALAQAWRDAGGAVLLAECDAIPAIDELLRGEGIGIIHLDAMRGGKSDAEATRSLARDTHASWLVTDGWWFDSRYQRTLSLSGLRTLTIDDKAEAVPYTTHLVLNQNLHANADSYRDRSPHTVLLMGPKYALLRREFRLAALRQRETATVARRLLVTLGGADPENATAKVVRCLRYVSIDGLSVTVAVGAANTHFEELARLAEESPRVVQVVRNVAAMSELMLASDVAITSGGTTVWELAALGVPSIVGAVSSIEELLLAGLDANGLFETVEWFRDLSEKELARRIEGLCLDCDRRERMARTAQHFVDGQGASRVAEAMLANQADVEG